jgi:hypothetical protein
LRIIRGVTTGAGSFAPSRLTFDLRHTGKSPAEHDERWLYGGNTPAATGNLISARFSPAGGGYIVIRES